MFIFFRFFSTFTLFVSGVLIQMNKLVISVYALFLSCFSVVAKEDSSEWRFQQCRVQYLEELERLRPSFVHNLAAEGQDILKSSIRILKNLGYRAVHLSIKGCVIHAYKDETLISRNNVLSVEELGGFLSGYSIVIREFPGKTLYLDIAESSCNSGDIGVR